MDLAGAVDGEPVVVPVAGRYKQIAYAVEGQQLNGFSPEAKVALQSILGNFKDDAAIDPDK